MVWCASIRYRVCEGILLDFVILSMHFVPPCTAWSGLVESAPMLSVDGLGQPPEDSSWWTMVWLKVVVSDLGSDCFSAVLYPYPFVLTSVINFYFVHSSHHIRSKPPWRVSWPTASQCSAGGAPPWSSCSVLRTKENTTGVLPGVLSQQDTCSLRKALKGLSSTPTTQHINILVWCHLLGDTVAASICWLKDSFYLRGIMFLWYLSIYIFFRFLTFQCHFKTLWT